MKLFRSELDIGISNKLFYIDANQLQDGETEFYKNKICGRISVEKDATGYHLRGKLNVHFKLNCDRCLDNFRKEKEIHFNMILTNERELLSNDSADVIFFPIEQNEVDLNPYFREHIYLEQQLKNICKDDCIGLCSYCGTNLNDRTCNCLEERKDNPWDALKNLQGN